MKKSLFFMVPLVAASLFSCGPKEVAIDFDEASTIVADYKTLIEANKAKDIHITGMVNSFDINGDIRLKTYVRDQTTKEQKLVDVDLKDSELRVAKQKLAEINFPVSLIKSYFPPASEDGTDKLYRVITILSTLPVNEKTLYLFDGFKADADGNIVHEKYTTINTNYCKVGNGLKVTMKTDDIIESIEEIAARAESPTVAESNIKVPASVSVTFSEIGYIQDLSISFKTPEKLILTSGDPELKSDRFYLHTNALINVDLSLHFTQTYYTPITLFYQVTEYEIKKVSDTPTTYKLVKNKTSDLYSNLEELEKLGYFTVDWCKYNNAEIGNSDAYDDPIFGINYWDKRARNIAFESDNYDALIIPAHDKMEKASDPWKPKFDILGSSDGDYYDYEETYKIKIPNNLCSISYNGYLISEPSPTSEVPYVKHLNGAKIKIGVDSEGKPIYYPENPKEQPGATNCAEVYLPAKYVRDTNGKYIVNIAVLKLPDSTIGE